VIVDRFGGLRVFTIGGVAYLIGCAILMLPGVEPGGPAWPFVVARIFQGIGIAGTLPSALSIVPELTDASRQGFGLAFMSSANNLTPVAMPPLSLAVLSAASLHGVALVMTGIVLFGLVVVWIRPFRPQPIDARDRDGGRHVGPVHEARRRFGFAFRRSWAPLIAIIVLVIAHWGVVVAYLPQRAEAAGADIGLFFVADGVAILLSRVPVGWLSDRTRPVILMLIGLSMIGVMIVLLALPPTTPLLVVAGVISGAGAGLVMTPILVELSRRSGDADRGSAFALFSAALASALVVGSIGGAPLVATFGFEVALLATLGGVVGAAAITLWDVGLRSGAAGQPSAANGGSAV
ncbi:MAG TPA: MFS transporter, partial [Methylomirabilota bacterium]|nr:MFS transporter [Methylomirabilota bacterium]